MTIGKYTYMYIYYVYFEKLSFDSQMSDLICITLFLPFSEHLFLVLFPPLHPKKNNQNFRVKKKVKIIFDSVGGHPATDTKQKEKKF